ncbi:DUF3147 family protein [Candidatus Falkowbacteria bacterium]|nr:DUF3147 family protein [Candidatus Falkowbacteria bacterium]
MCWGGAAVAGITVIVKYVHPKYAGVIYALPIILIVAMIFVYAEQGLAVSRQTLKSAFVYEFTLVYFILAFYWLSSHVDFYWSLGLALVSWAVIAALIQIWLTV